ncbi:hypothetical protein [Cohnella yongneupensis]|uniref:Uncharacterized protein n=1 Tax=Cohnella yongneupensis TaxID=425006 RepID=A0ABW0QVL8_9BACL
MEWISRFDAEQSPDWSAQLKGKLQRVCDRIRAQYASVSMTR